MAWVFTISKPSISLYYQSKAGTYKLISHHSFIGSSRHGISPMGTFYQLNLATIYCLLGVVFWQHNPLYEKGINGKLGKAIH